MNKLKLLIVYNKHNNGQILIIKFGKHNGLIQFDNAGLETRHPEALGKAYEIESKILERLDGYQ